MEGKIRLNEFWAFFRTTNSKSNYSFIVGFGVRLKGNPFGANLQTMWLNCSQFCCVCSIHFVRNNYIIGFYIAQTNGPLLPIHWLGFFYVKLKTVNTSQILVSVGWQTHGQSSPMNWFVVFEKTLSLMVKHCIWKGDPLETFQYLNLTSDAVHYDYSQYFSLIPFGNKMQ